MSEADYAGLIAAAHQQLNAPVILICLAARNVDQLAAIVKNRLKRIQYRPQLIDGFLAQTDRPHPRTGTAVDDRPWPFSLL
ncbi:MAG TPA: hypothetical protein VNF47_24705 [Streptosporangiaceae bacterium]|nr:hypothetical protein [Streptosporangiaceae bacterium]